MSPLLASVSLLHGIIVVCKVLILLFLIWLDGAANVVLPSPLIRDLLTQVSLMLLLALVSLMGSFSLVLLEHIGCEAS